MRTGLLLVGLVIAIGGVLLARAWTLLVGWMLLVYLCIAGFLVGQPLATTDLAEGLGRWVLPLTEIVSGIVVVGILLLTGLSFGQEYNLKHVDEFGLMEVRRVARRALRPARPSEWSDYLLPVAGLVITISAAMLLPRVYPFMRPTDSGLHGEEYAWILLLLAGLMQLVISQNMLKLGCGILLIGLGLQVLYIVWTPSIGLLVLALLNIALIVLALVVAYLSSLLYGRLKTLDLGELYGGGNG